MKKSSFLTLVGSTLAAALGCGIFAFTSISSSTSSTASDASKLTKVFFELEADGEKARQSRL